MYLVNNWFKTPTSDSVCYCMQPCYFMHCTSIHTKHWAHKYQLLECNKSRRDKYTQPYVQFYKSNACTATRQCNFHTWDEIKISLLAHVDTLTSRNQADLIKQLRDYEQVVKELTTYCCNPVCIPLRYHVKKTNFRSLLLNGKQNKSSQAISHTHTLTITGHNAIWTHKRKTCYCLSLSCLQFHYLLYHQNPDQTQWDESTRPAHWIPLNWTDNR